MFKVLGSGVLSGLLGWPRLYSSAPAVSAMEPTIVVLTPPGLYKCTDAPSLEGDAGGEGDDAVEESPPVPPTSPSLHAAAMLCVFQLTVRTVLLHAMIRQRCAPCLCHMAPKCVRGGHASSTS